MKLELQKRIDWVLGGILIVCLKPLVVFLGFLLKRDHQLTPRREICFIKMLGGGSLVIALPALLGIRNKYPDLKMTLVTTKGIADFGRALSVFDRVLVIDQSSLLSLARSSIVACVSVFRVDCFIDFEVYSRLTTVFSVLTCARNRIGFYLESAVWRKHLHTHLIYFNRNAPVHLFYERVAGLLGAKPANFADCQRQIYKKVQTSNRTKTIAIGPGCSSFARERILSAAQWVETFKERLTQNPEFAKARIELLGGADDFAIADEIDKNLIRIWPELKINNLCGKLPLLKSLEHLACADQFWGVDSALLHFARLFGVYCLSFWGPTAPETRLKNFNIVEEVHYKKISCSPCVHVAEVPPCQGKNLCIQALFDSSIVENGETADQIPVFLAELSHKSTRVIPSR